MLCRELTTWCSQGKNFGVVRGEKGWFGQGEKQFGVVRES